VVVGAARGVVHDPDHRPVAGAVVAIRAASSELATIFKTDENGSFEATGLPVGAYHVSVESNGFAPTEQEVVVSSLSAPGATLSNSFGMITDFVPGAWMTHDQLHVRGGHQVSWAIDGVPIPNTNIASNVGPQIDPKDIDYVEAERGGYSAAYGDRTYGVFDVVPRTGFEFDNEGEVYTTYGTFGQINDQINFGSHTQKFAYFASVNGNRGSYGLETPGPDVLQPVPLRHLAAARRLPDSQRPRCGPGGDPRRGVRTRCGGRFLLAAHISTGAAADGFAVLPFQPGELRWRRERFSAQHDAASPFAVRRGAGGAQPSDGPA